MDNLLQNVATYLVLAPEEEAYFLSSFQAHTVKRRQYFLQPGSINAHAAFVVQGCLRSYVVDESGAEHNLQFAPEGWWISDLASYLSATPSKLTIDALEDTHMLLLGKQQRENLFERIPRIERFFRVLAERSMVTLQERVLQNIGSTAEERYLYFLNKYPALAQRLPQVQIALYLGMTPEFLSKLKNDLLRR